MDKSWIPFITTLLAVIGTLSGVFIGGIISSVIKWIEIKNQRDLENKKLRLARLEELYQILANHTKNIIYTLERNEEENKNIEDAKVSYQILDYSFEKLDMNVEFYIPELTENLDTLVELEKELINEYFAYKILRKKQIDETKSDYQILKESAETDLPKLLKMLKESSLSSDEKTNLQLNIKKIAKLKLPFEQYLDTIPNKVVDRKSSDNNNFYKKLDEVESECKKMQAVIVKTAKKLII